VGTLFFQISSDPYPDPLLVRPDLPKEILPVIDRALKKNPDERYQTGAEMAADIKTILNKTAAPGPGTAPTPAKTAAPAGPAPVRTPPPAAEVKAAPAAAPSKPATQTPPAAKPAAAAPVRPATPAPVIKKEPDISQAMKKKPQPLTPPSATPAAPPAPAGPGAQAQGGVNKLQLEPPSATLSLSPQKAAAPLTDLPVKEAIPRPSEAAPGQPPVPRQEEPKPPAQPALKPAPLTASAPDFEKTLPLIYPEDAKK